MLRSVSPDWAHNSYLELMAEAGIPVLLLLLGLGIGWLTRALQAEMPPGERHAHARIPFDWRPVRLGIVAGVLAAAMHNFADSDLACFANLLTLSGLLALGLAFAIDGVYTVPVGLIERRGTALVLSASLGMSLTSAGLGELYANQVRYEMLVGHIPQALENMNIARSLDARNPDYLMDAGELYYALGRRETAFHPHGARHSPEAVAPILVSVGALL
jgi:tetratricopeptide (TPR) repeat protein